MRLAVPPGPVTRDGAAAAARAELGRAGYRRDRPSLIQRLVGDLIDHVTRAAAAVTSAVPGGIVGVLVLLALLVGLVVLVVVRLGPTRVRDIFGDGRTGRPSRRTAQDYRLEAETLAAAGDLAGAVRATTRAMVAELEQRGILEPAPGTTTAALSRQAALAVPAVGPDAAVVTSTFDEVWYAGRAATSDDVARVREAESRVAAQRLRVTAPA